MKAIEQQAITQSHIDQAMSYEDYRQLIDKLMSENKTTGENHSESMLEYTRLNTKRMSKWDKITVLTKGITEAMEKIDQPQTWIVITEAWCGDAAQNIPVINKIAALNSQITLKFLLRDEHLDVMDSYLTNGGRSIPKLVMLNSDTLNEIGVWGPRPEPVQHMLQAHKDDPNDTYAEFAERAHAWYAKDRTATLQDEFTTLLNEVN